VATSQSIEKSLFTNPPLNNDACNHQRHAFVSSLFRFGFLGDECSTEESDGEQR